MYWACINIYTEITETGTDSLISLYLYNLYDVKLNKIQSSITRLGDGGLSLGVCEITEGGKMCLSPESIQYKYKKLFKIFSYIFRSIQSIQKYIKAQKHIKAQRYTFTSLITLILNLSKTAHYIEIHGISEVET